MCEINVESLTILPSLFLWRPRMLKVFVCEMINTTSTGILSPTTWVMGSCHETTDLNDLSLRQWTLEMELNIETKMAKQNVSSTKKLTMAYLRML